MKQAYVHKNIRDLAFEAKLILGAHLATIIGCLFPWIFLTPYYGDSDFYTAFGGPTSFMGWIIFLLSSAVVAVFVQKVLQKHWFKLPLSESQLFALVGGQQLILIVSIWSVLISFGKEFVESELRFGIFLCFFAQILGLAAVYLQSRSDQRQKVVDFFQHPEPNTKKPSSPKKSAEK